MKSLLSLSVVVIFAGSALAQSTDNMMGMFFAEPFVSENTNLDVDPSPFSAFIVLLNPTVESVGGYEVGITVSPSVFFMAASGPNGWANFGGHDNHLAGYAVPLLVMPGGTVLSTLELFPLTNDICHIGFGEADPSSLHGVPAIADGANPADVIGCNLTSDDGFVATLNGPGIVIPDPEPPCEVTPGALDFGPVDLDGTRDLEFTIRNTGGGTLEGDVSEWCSDFDLSSGGGLFSLGAGESVSVNVQFAPTATGLTTCRVDLGSSLCDRLLVIADGIAGLGIYNAEEPTIPVEINFCQTPGTANGVFVKGHCAYVADSVAGLQIVNIFDPAAPVLLGSFATPNQAQDVHVAGRYAYVTAYNQGLRVIDVSVPAHPSEVGSYVIPDAGYAYGIDVVGDYAYVAASESGLVIIDISDPEAPTWAGSMDTPTWALDVFVVGNHAFVADGWGLLIVDVTDPTNLFYRGTYQINPFSYGIHVAGDYAYLASSTEGLKIFDVSDPSNPVLSGTYDTPDFARSVSVSGFVAYVADGATGLLGINVFNPANPVYWWTYDTPGSAVGVTVREGGDIVLTGTGVDVSGVDTPKIPAVFALHQNTPNPFNPMTTINYDLPEQTTVSLCLYDVSGRLVRMLVNGDVVAAGRREAVWRGHDEAGRQVAAGVYFYRLEAGPFSETKRMTLVK